MSHKINDIYLESQMERLQAMGGVIFEGEDIDTAIRREIISSNLWGMTRTKFQEIMGRRKKEVVKELKKDWFGTQHPIIGDNFPPGYKPEDVGC